MHAATAEQMEQWLAENTFRCQALGALVSPGACASYRQGRRALNSNCWQVPHQCQGCDEAPNVRRLRDRFREFKPQNRLWRD